MRFASRASRVAASATLEVMRTAAALRASGVDVLDLGPGEPDFPTPDFVKAAGISAIQSGFTRYTDASGTPELRAAIAERYAREWKAPWGPADVVVTNGGKQALHTAILALFEEGDDVLVPVPYWVSFPEMVTLAGARPVFVPTSQENGFRLTASDVEAAATPATRGILVNSPTNPSGAVIEPAEIEKIVRLCAARGWMFLFDECYDRFVFEGRHLSAAALAAEFPETVVLAGTFSKTYAMTGWRVGYACAARPVAEMIGRIVGHATSNVCSVAQAAALEALRRPDESAKAIERMLAEYRRRRAYLIPALNALPGFRCTPPGGTFYAFPDVSAWYGKTVGGVAVTGSASFAKALLDGAAVAVTPGSAFGEDRCVRISFATSMERLEEALKRLRGVLG
ncbi:MAG: pyridoxal phosphate-dependent aminotransferase [Acidobacteria bacterium]|nr:pyridoxal phosphate-dependent aminotransferase [Acidobacteriota bacterium]